MCASESCVRGRFAGVKRRKSGGVEGVVAPIYCKKKTCPECRKRYEKALYARIMNGILAQLSNLKGFRPKYNIKLLTLTCPGAEYRSIHKPEQALEEMIKAFDKMMRSLKKRLGKFHYFRIIELQKDGYPHFHVILVGEVIAPKSILNEIRDAWTQRYGMGNIDIQKNRTGKIKTLVGYLMKYLTKSVVELPRNRRLFTASRGFLAPVKKGSSDWLYSKVFWENFANVNSFLVIHASSINDLAGKDPELSKLVIEHWREELRFDEVAHAG